MVIGKRFMPALTTATMEGSTTEKAFDSDYHLNVIKIAIFFSLCSMIVSFGPMTYLLLHNADIRCDIDLKVLVYLLTSALWSNRYVIGPKETIMEHSKKKIAILITFRW